MRKYTVPQTTTLTYLVGDHLGSTSLAVDVSTGDVIQTRYKPCPYRVLREGEVRYTTPSKTLPTRYTFTGQYSYVSDDATDLGATGFGLMFYNARWHDSTIGRFAQADTVVPGGVQGLDRYAYVANNPIIYTDPSGHAQYYTGNWWSRHRAQLNQDPDHPFSLTFTADHPMSYAELQSAFIHWYAHVYQLAYEKHQYDIGDKASAFHNEDIPSAVLGAYFRSLDPNTNSVFDKDNKPTKRGQKIFNTAMTALGGQYGSGFSHSYLWDFYTVVDCTAVTCDATTPQNSSGFLKVKMGNYYLGIYWPGVELHLLNVILTGGDSYNGPR